MNRILFNFLVVGISLSGIQGSFAGKISSEEVRGVNKTPKRTPRKAQRPQMIPHGPMKVSQLSFGITRAEKSPNRNEIRGNTRWTIAPLPPTSAFSSMTGKGRY